MEYKVYKMDDYSWVATPWDFDKTVEWFQELTGEKMDDDQISDIKECDVDKDGMWDEVTNDVNHEQLGDLKELFGNDDKPRLGEYRKHYSDIYLYVSFREQIKRSGEPSEPFEIASTEF